MLFGAYLHEIFSQYVVIYYLLSGYFAIHTLTHLGKLSCMIYVPKYVVSYYLLLGSLWPFKREHQGSQERVCVYVIAYLT